MAPPNQQRPEKRPATSSIEMIDDNETTDPELIKAEEIKRKRREATQRCRQNQKDELAALEIRKAKAIEDNEKLRQQIEAVETLIKWMEDAVKAAVEARQNPN